MNLFARFDENPAMTLQDIKETKRYRRTDGQRENSIPSTNKVCGGGGYKYKNIFPETGKLYGFVCKTLTLLILDLQTSSL